jgi:hypothetical protein
MTFNRYAKNRKIGKANMLKCLRTIKLKGLNRIAKMA